MSPTSDSMDIIACEGSGASACGTSSLGIDNAAVGANPNSALSAQVTTTGHGGKSIQVLYQASGGPVQSTPKVAVEDGRSQVLPVLALLGNISYQLQVMVTDGSGKAGRSSVLSFKTGTPPAEVTSIALKVSNPGAVTDGYLLLSKVQAQTFTGPVPYFIIDRAGTVVWYSDNGTGKGDFQRQADGTYTAAVADAQSPLTYLRMDVLGNVQQRYVSPTAGEMTDNHELRVLPDGDVLYMGSPSQTVDLSALGGSDAATVVGNALYRVHADGGVAFQWSTFDHIDASGEDPTLANVTNNPLDETHCNSVDVTTDGNYLVSSRHKDQLWKLDAQSGAVLWKLGANGDFTFVNDPLNGFSGQHFAREISENDILLFDDGNGHVPQLSRAVEYKLDLTAKTATLVWSYQPSPAVFSVAMGSAERLANGHTLVDFGTASRVDEVDSSGTLLWQVTDKAPGFGFYRALYSASIY